MKKEIPKYGENKVLQFVGVKDLTIEEQELINDLSTKEFEKVKQSLKNTISMIIHVKNHGKKGAKNKYALHIRVIAPTGIIESCKSHDWDLARALRKSFEDIKNQIEHKFKGNSTREHKSHQKLDKRKREQNLLGSDQY